MEDVDYNTRTRDPDEPGAVRQVAGQAADAAGTAASEVAGTAKEQAREVAGEVKAQVRSLADDVRDRVGTQARSQNDKLADGLRRMSDELQDMARDRGDSPAGAIVTQVSQGGRRVADYLAENGPDGVLAEVQDFARRRPGAFLATALAAGFVVGRLGKGLFADSPERTPSRHRLAEPITAPAPLSAYDQQVVTGVVPAETIASGYTPGYDAGYPASTPAVSEFPTSTTTYAGSAAATDDEATRIYRETAYSEPDVPLPGRQR